MQRVMDQYMALLFSREFDRLDSDMDAAKAKNLKTTDGQPMLEFMHIGVSGCACGNLTEELWKVRKQALDEWLKRKPQSLNARLALAAYPLSYGWFRRTIGYANTVSQEAWTAFRKGIQESAAALLALDSEAKSDPRWYVEMLGIGLAAGWPRDRFDAIYQEATARYPDYYMLYFTAGQYYSARWYGSRNGRADQNRLIEQAAARATCSTRA